METHLLTEYVQSSPILLTPEERDALARLVPSLSVAPATGTDDAYVLTPGAEVGVTVVGEHRFVIQPKVSIDRLLFLLSYALDRAAFPPVSTDLPEADRLLAAVVPGFLHQLGSALSRGVLQGYVSVEDSLLTVRGRLRIEDQIRDRFGSFPPAEVRFDDYTEDIELNRMLKAAVRRLLRLAGVPTRYRHGLRAFEETLGNVADVEYHRDVLPRFVWTRLNDHYRHAIALSRLILRSCSFDIGVAGLRASAFLVNMNEVFEDFVVKALRQALKLSDRDFPQGATGKALRLDELNRIRLRPDISWWSHRDCLFVGDVKYKRITPAGFPNADIYQMLAYVIAADLPGGLLIYAAGEQLPAVHTIRHSGKTVEIIALDLAEPPEAILEQIDGIAKRIRELRDLTTVRAPALAQAVM